MNKKLTPRDLTRILEQHGINSDTNTWTPKTAKLAHRILERTQIKYAKKKGQIK